jgi:sec-independent protein translocase protein TatB
VWDIGAGELIGLAVLALLVLGPDKLPGYAADAARFVRQIRRMANDARAEVTKELGPELQGLELRDINPRALVRKHVLDGFDLDDDDETPRRVNGSGPDGSGAANGSTASQGAATSSASAAEPAPHRPAPFDPDTT